MADQQVAVLIDFENVGLNSIRWLFDQVSDFGRVIVKRAYADWSAAGNRRNDLLELGIDPVHLFHTSGSKNSSDIRLAIDAIELHYQSPVDTFVIVSSDSDFVPLVNKLRGAGKSVIGAGPRAAASRTLVLSCDRYFYLDEGSGPPAERAPRREHMEEALLVRAVKAAMDDEGRVGGGKLHRTLLRLEPSFDFRALGFSTFTKFLEASPLVRVSRPPEQSDVVVELRGAEAGQEKGQLDPRVWAAGIDAAWSRRAPKPGQLIVGSAAAGDAAAVLGVARLSASPFKTLQRLLDASDHLRARWRRDGNRIVRS